MLACLATAAASAATPFSTLDPAGPSARAIAWLWWIMAGTSIAITLGMIALACHGTLRKSRSAGPSERTWLLGGGILFPSLVLSGFLGMGAYAGWSMADRLAAPPFTVQIRARQWHWEARYPETELPLVRSVNVVHIHLRAFRSSFAFRRRTSFTASGSRAWAAKSMPSRDASTRSACKQTARAYTAGCARNSAVPVTPR